MLSKSKHINASPMSATITPPAPSTIAFPKSISWMLFLDLFKTTASTSAQTKMIPKKIESPPTPSLNQLILDHLKLVRKNQMDFRFFGSSTLNSKLQWGQETKSPTASTSSLDLQRGQWIFTSDDSNLVQVDARDFFTGANAGFIPRTTGQQSL